MSSRHCLFFSDINIEGNHPFRYESQQRPILHKTHMLHGFLFTKPQGIQLLRNPYIWVCFEARARYRNFQKLSYLMRFYIIARGHLRVTTCPCETLVPVWHRKRVSTCWSRLVNDVRRLGAFVYCVHRIVG